MIRKRKKEIISPYQKSFYRYKKQPSVFKWLVLIGGLISLLFYVHTAYADSANHDNSIEQVIRPSSATSGQLFLTPAQAQSAHYNRGLVQQNALMLHSSVNFEVTGLIATVTLTQSFINQGEFTASGVYAFPLPEDAAVNFMEIRIGNRIIKGKIMEKAHAQKVFAKASQAGQKASLVEQHRPNLFTNKIANIAPAQQITVTLKYVQQVGYRNDKFTLRFPMTYTPRYITNNQSNLLATQLPSLFTGKPSLPNNRGKMLISFTLEAGVPLESISSQSHKVSIKSNNQYAYSEPTHRVKVTSSVSERLLIDVLGRQVTMDRDFVISWQPLASDKPQVSLFTEQINGQEYTLAMILPPVGNKYQEQSSVNKFSRDITFVIDTSGSMQGTSIEQARSGLLFALDTLSAQDSFNIIAFNHGYQQQFPTTVMATKQNVKLAKKYINRLGADGGTEMYHPLQAALTMPIAKNQNSEAIRQVLFLTDGAVSNEVELFQLIQGADRLPRLFTVGIGSAPNGFFMKKAAQFGQGSYTYIASVAEVDEKMSSLLLKISEPVLRNVSLQFQPLHLGAIEQFPKKIPDLYQGEPLVVAFKTAKAPSSLQVFGDLSGFPWHHEVVISKTESNNHMATIWARAKIDDLLDGLVTGQQPNDVRTQVLATSLLHQVMSPYTSFIAVEEMLATDNSAKKENKPSQAQSNQALAFIPFPKTALGWQQQLLIGILLLLISGVWWLRIKQDAM